ncbi:calcium-dependent lipid-binding (CaLB domain) family protein [Citrus sinensis]|uniref:C2 domain-containing protein At1g53590 isoform X2 n=1 Tax=Citrus sinensis TaxID=2711 RepID=UPI000CED3CBB|nr:C2 domain-containing protein At1g53590 isoform X2 [Citrus sinensis]XP_024043401.1 C2 domain-containing protein At1g53590 isoform X2 [Citrus x clementina]KAH9723635.1 calcium-dependent lipid-binding (CaLB domain) family protein [Citrus sinensis]
MSLMEISIMHHVGIVLFLLWLLSYFDRCHPAAYFISLIYLYSVHDRYVMRLRRKVEFEERKNSFQRRVLKDSETVRWLNHAIEKMWPICMEQIASQKLLLPIIPWFLEKYKPWTAKKALVQHLYLGRNPPMLTEMRVLRQSNDDDHMVLELGMNFLTADDMSAILAVKLRKRLGFGMWAKMHVTGMHVEGKVLVGVKFLRRWPFIDRLRVCFAEPPYFQMTVKPIFTHGLDVTEFPGIAGWLDKLLSIAFEQTLVEPNMLVVDVDKFASPQPGNWFSVDVKEPVAYARVEVVEASDMKPSDLNGLADPYVKGQLGPYRFRTKTQRKTLSPKWHEEFNIPISTWDSPNVLVIEVRDKDHFVDDTLGDCTINISDLRDGQRHDMWIPLQNIKIGRLHLAITVLEESAKGVDSPCDGGTLNKEGMGNKEDQSNKKDIQESFANETTDKGSFSSVSSEKSPKVVDNFEPINIEGQQETGIWVHQPGSEVAQTWEPRKGKNRRLDTLVRRVPNGSFNSTNSAASGSLNNDSSSTDDNQEGKNSIRRGLRKIGSMFQRNSRKEDHAGSIGEAVPSPRVNLRAVNTKDVGVKFIVEDSLSGSIPVKATKDINVSSDESGPESPSRGHVKGMAKSIMKHAEKHARSIKHAFSRKDSTKRRGGTSPVTERELYVDSDSSDDESLPSSRLERIPDFPIPMSSCSTRDDNCDTKEQITRTSSSDPEADILGQTDKVSADSEEKKDDDEVNKTEGVDDGQIEFIKPELSEGDLKGAEDINRGAETDVS